MCRVKHSRLMSVLKILRVPRIQFKYCVGTRKRDTLSIVKSVELTGVVVEELVQPIKSSRRLSLSAILELRSSRPRSPRTSGVE